MKTTFYKDIEDIFSINRLSVYRQDGCDDTTALSRYLYNIEICKTLYPILHIFEITLRNSIDKSLTDFSGTQLWYDSLNLNTDSKLKVSTAKNKIQNKNKEVTHDRLISEMTLGFWTAFLTTRYSQSSFQSFIIKTALKDMPKNLRNTKSIQSIFEKMRLLRNRVSHYERLIHWKDLTQQHKQLLECIKWLSPVSFELAIKINCFDKIIQDGITPWINLVKENRN